MNPKRRDLVSQNFFADSQWTLTVDIARERRWRTSIWWALRRARNAVRDHVLWVRQGCPTDGPIVLRVGTLEIWPDGHRAIQWWSWSSARMSRPIKTDELWEFLALRYPEAVRSTSGYEHREALDGSGR